MRYDGRNGYVFTWLLCCGEVYYANENLGPIRRQDTSCNNNMVSVCLVSVVPYLCQAFVPVSRKCPRGILCAIVSTYRPYFLFIISRF